MKRAFTLVELLVVVLILGLLSTIVVGVFTTQVERARFSAARSTISAIELAVERYQLDVGTFPPSGSGTASPATSPATGTGWLQLTLMHSTSGNSSAPSSPLWRGPYLTVKKQLLGDSNGIPLEESTSAVDMTQVQILDPWHSPYTYIRSGPSGAENPSTPGANDDYAIMGGTTLPSSHPFALTETYYNPNTYQIYSKGPNSTTLASPNGGTDGDDVSNFGQ